MLYQTHVLVHLNNIRENILNIRQAVGPKRKILVAVKANAYGHGAVEVSKMCETATVDWLGVATVPEAIELREAGIKMPIMKFSPVFEDEISSAIDAKLALCVCTEDNIKALNLKAKEKSSVLEVHLKIDTGMGRIGAQPSECAKLTKLIISSCANLKLGGIMTHFPVSDEANKTFTQRQLKLFKRVVADTEKDLSYKFPMVHCANSGAILAHPEAWLDMVRPGIMVYGFYPSREVAETIELKPGLSFKTRVSFVKKITKGTSVGYGRTWVAPDNCFVATFPAGYADGFNRLFSNTGRVLINGKSYPVIGRVCMDQSMCNLGVDQDVKVGDEVILIGSSGKEEITGYEWAEKLDTITYEVTCQINSRVKRYFDDF